MINKLTVNVFVHCICHYVTFMN